MRLDSRSILAIIATLLLAATVSTQPAQAQTFKVLHTFHGGSRDGLGPYGAVILDQAGNLYGTTSGGGTGVGQPCGNISRCGTVFKMNKSGKLTWLYSFHFGNGAGPMVGLLRDTAGDLYGTTTYGGKTTGACGNLGCGVVFKLNKTGSRETVLHRFKGQADGENPESVLTEDTAGYIYGTTIFGGIAYGVVFRVDPAGKETVLYTFEGGTDGGSADSGLIWGTGTRLYGGAGFGAHDHGIVFAMDTAGRETVLYNFSGTDGDGPSSVLIADAAGNLYGTTQGGGNSECGGTGCGVVFKLSPQSYEGWTESVLTSFARFPAAPTARTLSWGRWLATQRETCTAPRTSEAVMTMGRFSSWILPARKLCCIVSQVGLTERTLGAV
jgi:uncharacterized repeat protein (TIGR03803 family)